jgi:hypothetical protein
MVTYIDEHKARFGVEPIVQGLIYLAEQNWGVYVPDDQSNSTKRAKRFTANPAIYTVEWNVDVGGGEWEESR